MWPRALCMLANAVEVQCFLLQSVLWAFCSGLELDIALLTLLVCKKMKAWHHSGLRIGLNPILHYIP